MKMTMKQTPESDAACSLLSLINAATHIDPAAQDNNKSDEAQRSKTPRECPIQPVSSFPCATSVVSNVTTPATAVPEQKSAKIQFPMILMNLLDEPSNSDVATFLPDGKSFSILRPERFASELLPSYFRMTKFSSFIRKLYRWGFRQLNGRTKSGCVTYHHPLFRRGDVSLCRKIKCQKSDNKPAPSIMTTSGLSQPTISTMQPLSSCQSVLPRKGQRAQQQEVSPVRSQSQPTAPQQSVNDATETVLKAALEVLNKDSALPSTSSLDLDQMTRRLLGSSKIGRRSNMLNGALNGGLSGGALPMRSNFLLGRPVLGGGGLLGMTVSRSIMPGSLNDFQLKK